MSELPGVFHHLVDIILMIFDGWIRYNIFGIKTHVSLHLAAHFSSSFNSFCNIEWSLCLFICLLKKLWWVKSRTCIGESLIWQRNINGPIAVPCGTPDSTGSDSECSLSTKTLICLSWRKELSHLCRLPLIPYESNLCSSLP